ncbi:MAG TPA: 2-oxoglutarate and iron-dependent oxygenase domain-containing protein [Acidimicrobiia bacterium]
MASREPPVIDVSPLFASDHDARADVARNIDVACRDQGFFSIVGHGIDPALLARLESLAREFFALDDSEKAAIAMARGGRAWRGWFPLGGELTSGVPDRKEGVYFGEELTPDDPRVVARLPLHGPNLFPARPAALRTAVLETLDALTFLGHRLMTGFALALGLDAGWFDRALTADPVILFRIFHYPALAGAGASAEPGAGFGTDSGTDGDAGSGWGVAEHTDYGLLTILYQDDGGGLELHTRDGWVEVPPHPGALVCNLGDMLERMTGGAYRSTPHRVRPPVGRDRIACPFFFDPGWDAQVRPILDPAHVLDVHDGADRWDGASVFDFDGTYGDYLLDKVSKVFPALRDQALQ